MTHLLTRKEVAAILNIGVSSFDRLVKRKQVKVTRIGRSKRFTRTEVEKFIERRTN